MQDTAPCVSLSKTVSSESFSIKTTLYELIEAVNKETTPDEKHWVTLIVDNILRSGRSVS